MAATALVRCLSFVSVATAALLDTATGVAIRSGRIVLTALVWSTAAPCLALCVAASASVVDSMKRDLAVLNSVAWAWLEDLNEDAAFVI